MPSPIFKLKFSLTFVQIGIISANADDKHISKTIPEDENMPCRYDLQLCWNLGSRFASKNDTFLSKQREEIDPHFLRNL